MSGVKFKKTTNQSSSPSGYKVAVQTDTIMTASINGYYSFNCVSCGANSGEISIPFKGTYTYKPFDHDGYAQGKVLDILSANIQTFKNRVADVKNYSGLLNGADFSQTYLHKRYCPYCGSAQPWDKNKPMNRISKVMLIFSAIVGFFTIIPLASIGAPGIIVLLGCISVPIVLNVLWFLHANSVNKKFAKRDKACNGLSPQELRNYDPIITLPSI